MKRDKTKGMLLVASERRRKILELRIKGYTYRDIGEAVGCSLKRAHAIVTLEMERLSKLRTDAAEGVREMELNRLDAMQRAIWDRALGGEMSAIAAVLRIMERRAKLLGLDKAEDRPDYGQTAAEILIQADRLGITVDPEDRKLLEGPKVVEAIEKED